MVRRASCDEVTSLATRVCCLKGGVILPAGSLQSACLLNSEDGLLTFEFLLPAAAHGQQCPGCGWVSAYLPLRNLGHRAPFCDGCMDDLHLVCKSSGTPLPFAPPYGGGIWYIKPPRHYYQQRLDNPCLLQAMALWTSTSEWTLREAI